MNDTKFCKFCGKTISADAVICTHCGRQVESLQNTQSPVIINNSASSSASSSSTAMPTINTSNTRKCNKWVSLALCGFLGYFGAHKFYEGKMGTGLLYMCTAGGFLIGMIIDFFNILGKPEVYDVN